MLYLIIFLIIGHLAGAQQPYAAHYTIKDGLPSNTIYNIYSDSKGYLWFATDKGIARYNGSSFKTFTTADGIPDNEVFFFKEDYEGRLWMATFNGKLCYLKNNKFHTEKNTPWLKINKKLIHIYNINIEPDSSVTIQFGNNLYFININREKIKIVPMDRLMNVLEKPLFTAIPMRITKKNNNKFIIFSIRKQLTVDSNGNCLSWSFHKNGALFCPVNGPSNTYFSFNDTVYDKNLPIYTIRNRHETENCLVLKDSSLIMLGRANGLFINDSIHLFKNHNIPSITKDFQDNFWVSSYGDGAYMLPKGFIQTTIYKSAYTGEVCHATTVDNKLYFITEEATIYRENKNNDFKVIHNGFKDILFLNPAHRIFRNEFALIVTFEKILLLKNLNTYPTIKSFNNTFGNAKEILFSDKNIYFCGPLVIFKIDLNTLLSDSKMLHEEFLKRRTHTGWRISSHAMDDMGTVWFSINDSIMSYDNGKLTCRLVQKGETFRKMLVRDNYVITYTDNNLLLLYNRKEDTIDSIKIKEAIWDNMYFINNNTLLLTTNKEYYLLTLDHKITHYSHASLVPVKKGYIPEQPKYIVAGKDHCYFFKESQITRIDTKLLFEKDPAPKVIYTSFLCDTVPQELKASAFLSYEQSKNIKLNFEALSFASRDLSYEYAVSDDSIDNWQSIQGTELNLLVPSYGTYTIKVRAKTTSSDYSPPAVMVLIINRPYWATWWFWAVCTLTLAAITWVIVRWRTKKILVKKQLEFETEKRYQQAEYKALNALMNPHFIFNSMNNIQGLINEDEKQTANEYLVIFSEMIRQNMHNIDQGTISLHKELVLCKNYLELEKLRFKELINFRFEVEEDIDTEDVSIPPLLVQPLIENAIRHGLLPKQSPDSMVVIRIKEEDDMIIIEVEDNGIGLAQAAKNKSSLHQSVGLSNMQKRMEHIRKMHQREITFSIEEIQEENGIVKGTMAIIKMTL